MRRENAVVEHPQLFAVDAMRAGEVSGDVTAVAEAAMEDPYGFVAAAVSAPFPRNSKEPPVPELVPKDE